MFGNPSKRQRTPFAQVTKAFLFLACGTACLLALLIIVFEVLTRHLFPDLLPNPPIMEADSDLRWCLKRNLNVTRYSGGRALHVVTNSKRLRELHDIPYENRSGAERVLFLGDSFTFGAVSTGEDFVSATERCLRIKTGSSIECINMGAPDIGASLELLYYLKEGRKYGACVVFVQVCGNDVADDARDNAFVIGKDGNLEETPFRPAWRQRFMTTSSVYLWLSTYSSLLRLVKMKIPELWYNAKAVARQKAAYKSSGFAAQAPTTKKVWGKLIDHIREDGAVPIFLLVAEPLKSSSSGDVYALAADVAKSKGVRVICPVKALEDALGNLENARISASDGHWNVAANKMVGSLLCRAVLQAFSDETVGRSRVFQYPSLSLQSLSTTYTIE